MAVLVRRSEGGNERSNGQGENKNKKEVQYEDGMRSEIFRFRVHPTLFVLEINAAKPRLRSGLRSPFAAPHRGSSGDRCRTPSPHRYG